ncbi:hypothetical protein, partial [Candidatus Solincola tengchongensis]|uniref:hypothetical protein n=1 Tax=Candidatus Solincola tengchongensis TaxID=2900693 RepID=UPI00257E45D6
AKTTEYRLSGIFIRGHLPSSLRTEQGYYITVPGGLHPAGLRKDKVTISQIFPYCRLFSR